MVFAMTAFAQKGSKRGFGPSKARLVIIIIGSFIGGRTGKGKPGRPGLENAKGPANRPFRHIEYGAR
jgi:hypothetical protein